MKAYLEKQNKILVTESTNATLRYYFGPEDNILLQNLELIMNPRKKIAKYQQIKKFKEFGNNFLSLVFTKKNFQKDFLNYLECHFRKTYGSLYLQRVCSLRKQIFKKFKKKHQNFSCNLKQLEKLEKLMEDYLINRQQCKLPWSLKEIEQAIEDLQQRIITLSLV